MSGTSATRRSPGNVSLTTPTIMVHVSCLDGVRRCAIGALAATGKAPGPTAAGTADRPPAVGEMLSALRPGPKRTAPASSTLRETGASIGNPCVLPLRGATRKRSRQRNSARLFGAGSLCGAGWTP